MIQAKDVLSEAYRSLRHNRERSALTMLGMAWGITTVVLLLAYGTGFPSPNTHISRRYARMVAMGIAGGRTSMQAGGNKAVIKTEDAIRDTAVTGVQTCALPI